MRRRQTVTWLITWWITAAVLTSLPYLIGASATPDTEVYLARSTQSPSDTAAYWSMIEQARQGRFVFANQFTSEPQSPSMFHPLWLVTGWMAEALGLSTPLAYHVIRLAAILAWIGAVWAVMCRIFVRTPDRWLALGVVTTSSGLGWLGAAVSGPDRVLSFYDLWVAESVSWLSMMHSALFVLSQAAMLWMLVRLSAWYDSGAASWREGIVLAALALTHPYDLVTLAVVAAVVTVIALQTRRRTVRAAGALLVSWGAPVLPVTAYYLTVVLDEPAMRGWFAQNQTPTGPATDALIGFGLLAPLALLGWFGAKKTPLHHVLLVWVIVAAALMALPGLSFQRRLVNGLHIPLAAFSAVSIIWLRDHIAASWRTMVLAGTMVILAASNILVMLRDIAMLRGSLPITYQASVRREEYAAITYIREAVPNDAVILSDIWIGNAVAGLAGRTVALGHGHQTVDIQTKLRYWDDFRAPVSGEERTRLLDRLRVTHLVWRDADRRPGGYDPSADSAWEPLQQYGGTTVYRRR